MSWALLSQAKVWWSDVKEPQSHRLNMIQFLCSWFRPNDSMSLCQKWPSNRRDSIPKSFQDSPNQYVRSCGSRRSGAKRSKSRPKALRGFNLGFTEVDLGWIDLELILRCKLMEFSMEEPIHPNLEVITGTLYIAALDGVDHWGWPSQIALGLPRPGWNCCMAIDTLQKQMFLGWIEP